MFSKLIARRRAVLYGHIRCSLNREDLSAYDLPVEPLHVDKAPSLEHFTIEKLFTDVPVSKAKQSKKARLHAMREKMDEGGLRVMPNASVTPASQSPVPGEWVVAPNANPSKRLLYIHGGAFVMGSPQSHRLIASKFSEVSGAAVFVVDYRLCPENTRLDCLEDCQTAYQWLINNGPDGEALAEALYIAGDSAGGNLCLVLLPWIRDQGLRAPDAAVALSPATDGTLSSPSIRTNLNTDAMLKTLMTGISKIPKPLLLVGMWMQRKVRSDDPRLSPIHSKLDHLPPLLIQASAAECLEDDARRYTNKARLAGSVVQLQLWTHMVHVWHAFEPELAEAKDAFKDIGVFFRQVHKERSEA